MEITVEEGRLIETATPGATGMERRAFGEFVSPRGELASYAFGWVTDADPHEGRLSVGIGAGNPGGATFHAVIGLHDGGFAFSLVDEPFEDLPEGGPDLTAEEAREHDTLPFVWWVAEEAMDRDRRARWLWHWLVGTTSVQTPEVFELSEPVLLVSHEEDDGVWQLIGETDAHGEPVIGHLYHAVDEDPTLLDILDLEPGERAERDRVGGEWVRS
jgi:hypothetical protein